MLWRNAAVRDCSSQLRILVLGYLVREPLGGLAWHHLQYVLGLLQLGHDAWFLEDSDDYESCYNPTTHAMGRDPSYGLKFTGDALTRLDHPDRWAYYDDHTKRWLGPASAKVEDLCHTADLLINVSAVNPVRPWYQNIARRVLIDTDPVFTQIKHLTDKRARQLAEGHNCFFTLGQNFGKPGCGIPDDGFPWQPTRQPVVLDAWPVTPGCARRSFYHSHAVG